jgi:phosphoribosylformimino-5-aminoimidazole carboxamide ribotide isomerase
MDIIPVIDLKGGLVVHARQGRRDEYRPIKTPLSATANPADVVAGLLRLHSFHALYVADLDTIEGDGGNRTALAALPPRLDIWLDAGVRDAAGAASWAGSLVLGSESQRDARLLASLRDDPRLVLSLDFRGDAFQGPPEILADAQLWPGRVIAMTLARVGAEQGPDLARLAEIARRAGAGRRVYAAGGVRNLADLRAAASAGAAGALVATALHAGAIQPAEIAEAARL